MSLEGIIGSGKSTLLRQLKQMYHSEIEALEEPVTLWQDVRKCQVNNDFVVNEEKESDYNLLMNMYTNGKRWGFSFQVMYMFV